MKVSQLISVLEDVKKHFGDKYIWSLDDLTFPCPSGFEIELSSKLKRTDMGLSGGKADLIKRVEVSLEYEGGVDLVDRSLEEIEH